MSRVQKGWLFAALAAAGCGLTLVVPAAGVVLAVGACFMACGHTFSLNVPATRLAAVLCAASCGGALYVATGSLTLAASVLVVVATMMPMELTLRRKDAPHNLLRGAGVLVGVVLVLVSHGAGYYRLAPLPFIGMAAMGTFQLGKLRRTSRAAQGKIKLRVGEPLPDFSLPRRGAAEGPFSISDARGRFVLLVFVREDWCAICHVIIRLISRERAALARHDVRLFIVTPTQGDVDAEWRQQLAPETELLWDEGSATARRLGLIEMQQPGNPDVPLPVALLVDQDGIVRDITGPEDVSNYLDERRLESLLERAATAHAQSARELPRHAS